MSVIEDIEEELNKECLEYFKKEISEEIELKEMLLRQLRRATI